MKKLYIAGPDVFRQDWMSYAEQVVAACSAIQCEALLPIPVDADLYATGVRGVTVDGTSLDADMVFESCLCSVEQADIVIANINPFRGDEPDSGTVFEIATAHAMHKPVFGHTADRRMTHERYLYGNKTKNGAILCDAGHFVERFNLPCNVMVASACKKIVYGDVFDAIKIMRDIYKDDFSYE